MYLISLLSQTNTSGTELLLSLSFSLSHTPSKASFSVSLSLCLFLSVSLSLSLSLCLSLSLSLSLYVSISFVTLLPPSPLLYVSCPFFQPPSPLILTLTPASLVGVVVVSTFTFLLKTIWIRRNERSKEYPWKSVQNNERIQKFKTEAFREQIIWN